MNWEGTVAKVGREWIIRGGADVLFRAHRSIMNAGRKEGVVVVPDTDEAATDILWFAQRFKVDILEPAEIRAGAARFARSQASASQVLAPNYSPSPITFRDGKVPRHYQLVAKDLFLRSRSLLLADEVGLGKTISTAAALLCRDVRPMAIVLPVHLSSQWAETLQEFVGQLRVHEVRTGKIYDRPEFRQCRQCGEWSEQRVIRNRLVSESNCQRCGRRVVGPTSGPDVYILSYHKLQNWGRRLADECNSVVYDEVQELRRSKSAKWEAACTLSSRVKYRLGLSATPVFNLGGEIFNVMQCIAPGRLGTKETFRETWCSGFVSEGKEPKLRDPEEMGTYLRSQHLMLRRTRSQVGRELPSHSRVVHAIEADLAALDSIRGHAADLARIILQGSSERGAQLNASGQLEAIVRQQTGLAKAPFVAGFVEMLLEQNTPLVLFGWHRAVYEVWLELLAKHNPVLYTGSESPAAKAAAKNAFVSGKTDLLICSLRSGSGLDGLQYRCSTAVFGELDWAPAVHHQCSGRVYRDGQKNPSMSYFLVCEYLTDPLIARALGLKKAQSDGLLGNQVESDAPLDTSHHIKEIARQYIARKAAS